MNDALTLLVKAVNGGLFVVLFAVIGEVLVPRRFSGVFAAAPSVALANLTVIGFTKGTHVIGVEGAGMAVGAVALVVACLAGGWFVARWKALRGSIAVCATWLVVAVGGYAVVFR